MFTHPIGTMHFYPELHHLLETYGKRRLGTSFSSPASLNVIRSDPFPVLLREFSRGLYSLPIEAHTAFDVSDTGSRSMPSLLVWPTVSIGMLAWLIHSPDLFSNLSVGLMSGAISNGFIGFSFPMAAITKQ